MLSNGLGLHLGGVKMRQLVFDYTFDFTASGPVIIESILGRGGITFQYGQNAPGESTNDWLAGTYTEHWTANGFSGFQFDVQDIGVTGLYAGKKGDLGVMSYKIYLDGDWDGTDNINMWGNKMYNYSQSSLFDGVYPPDLPQDYIVSVEVSKDRSTSGHALAKFNNWHNIASTRNVQMFTGQNEAAGDSPNIGAVIYMKDLNFQIWR
tara:strand:+ start:1337 stop:1957 length:621 start_codon:yes stop_codon:yes gene_type:complete